MDSPDGHEVSGKACPLARYCSTQEAKPPCIVPTEAEAKPLAAADGLKHLAAPPVADVALVPAPPMTIDEAKISRYLWAVVPDLIPYALEQTAVFGLELIKHTNLTGGVDAFSGGELWFIDERSFAFNGSSGRYGPRSKSHLDEICTLFRKLGYRVACTGFDTEVNRSRPVFLEDEVRWMEAAE